MGNFLAVRSFIYIAGNIIDPNQNNTNENTIYSQHNAAFDGTTGHMHSGSTGDGPKIPAANIVLNSGGSLESSLCPVGTIIAFYDYNGLLTFDSAYWQYCNGQTLSFPVIGNQTTPDGSGRYFVGFGTDGGGNNGSAAWATTPVGNAGNTINIQHSHTVNSHNHDSGTLSFTLSNHTHTSGTLAFSLSDHTHNLANHTHTSAAHSHTITNQGSHNHDSGTYQFQVADISFGGGKYRFNVYKSDGTSNTIITDNGSAGGGTVDFTPLTTQSDASNGFTSATATSYFTKSGSGNSGSTSISGSTDSTTPGSTGVPSNDISGAPSTDVTGAGGGSTGSPSFNFTGAGSGNTGNASPGTDSQLSAAQSIQPISIRVRWLIRYK